MEATATEYSMEEISQQLREIGRTHGATRIVLYGSRARGDNRPRSDIDLAVYGVSKADEDSCWLAIDNIPTFLQFDVVFVGEGTSPALLRNIKEDGIIIYEETQL